jgi:hypothetical protein
MSETNKTPEIIEEETKALSEEESENAEEQPVFYNPVSVLQMDGFLKWTAIIMVAATIGSNLLSLQTMAGNVAYLLTKNQTPSTFAWIITVVLFLIVVGASSAVYYFPLRALGKVLKILMEMEYNSRGVKE